MTTQETKDALSTHMPSKESSPSEPAQPLTTLSSPRSALWRHMHDEHGLTLLESELDEIELLAKACSADEPAADYMAPIACIRVGEDDTCEVLKLYAPGLPPGEHDLYPAASSPPPLEKHPDTDRLDFLDSQRKWGDCFMVQDIDSGDVYVRPWRSQNQARWPARIVASDIRAAIDLARATSTKGNAP